MSAFLTAFPGVVRAVVTDVGLVLGTTETSTRAVKSRALWDTGAVTSVIDKSLIEQRRSNPMTTSHKPRTNKENDKMTKVPKQARFGVGRRVGGIIPALRRERRRVARHGESCAGTEADKRKGDGLDRHVGEPGDMAASGRWRVVVWRHPARCGEVLLDQSRRHPDVHQVMLTTSR